jgi:signal recognition particle receptor subunit beta
MKFEDFKKDFDEKLATMSDDDLVKSFADMGVDVTIKRMKTLLFLNPGWGVDFMLKRKMATEGVEHPYIPLFEETDKQKKRENDRLYKKHEIKSTPVLIVLDKTEEVDRITGVEDILKYLKDNNESIDKI